MPITVKCHGIKNWLFWTIIEGCEPFLYSMATHLDAIIQFHTSDIILHADTNALYLTEPQSRSCPAGYFFLWSIPSKCSQDRLNGPVHVNGKILKFVAASSYEEETGGYFVTGRGVVILQNTLETFGHPQPVKNIHRQYNSLRNSQR